MECHPDPMKCGRHNFGRIDILKGGRERETRDNGSATARRGVRYEFLRLIKEVRPSWVSVENVVRFCHTADGSGVVTDLAEARYAWGASLLGTEIIGTPHPRPRVWIVACNDYPYGDGDIDEGVEARQLLDNLQRAFAENNKQGNYWKRQLGTGDDGKDGPSEESQSAAYGGGVRRIHDDA